MSESLRLSRQFSLRSVVEAIVQGGAISRASIAKQTGLSKQTISEVMRQLEDEGWVRETGRTSGHVGRTAVTYEIVPTAAYIGAVDLGGTKVRVAICNLACQVIGEVMEPTHKDGGAAIIAQIARLMQNAAENCGIEMAKLRIAVIGVPGAPQADSGKVLLAPNIAGFDQMDVASELESALGCDVMLENDVNLAVLGESWLGVGQGHDNLAYIALGTGVGSGLMLNGQLVRGANNAAGELGFLPFGADPFEPESLRAGAFERLAASYGILARYRSLAGSDASVPAIFDKANAGEAHAVAVLDETARLLARGIGAIAAIANPDKVILGGSIGTREELVARVKAMLPICFPYSVAVEASELGEHAALVGATAIGLNHLHNTLFGADAPESRISLPPANAVSIREALN
ncbi:ROK family transcriptional regulator [Devosia faecipullorum]|uniref:ROK family transcriptional regulator n=1 Tax=Devosia faecipullorum TaxID=2755039 RepID=UPI00187B11BD|nr:ROK family transcriptional regulator [Devosia faecipullorum]MBE7732924.1 ROK family transcriptional regulator [Devosia faecipullorum]